MFSQSRQLAFLHNWILFNSIGNNNLHSGVALLVASKLLVIKVLKIQKVQEQIFFLTIIF